MKKLILINFILIGVVFSACTGKTHNRHHSNKDNNSYERANEASKKALKELDRE